MNRPYLRASRTRRSHVSRPTLEVMEQRQLLAVFTVTNTVDSGAGSLRQAILDADLAGVASTIDFSIPGSGVQKIVPQSDLPSITAPITIDGTTQPGYASTPLVAIDGSSGLSAVGLSFDKGAAGSLLEGLAIDRFSGFGIAVHGPNVTIQDDLIGVDPTNHSGAGNGVGIVFFGDITAAGPVPGLTITGNIIAANSDGVDLQNSINAVITNNFIGTDSTGRTDIGNSNDGIFIDATCTSTGVTNNVIANNGKLGIDGTGEAFFSQGNTLTHNGDRVANLAVTSSTSSVTTTTGTIETITYQITNQGPAIATHVSFSAASQTYLTYLDYNGQTSGVIQTVGAETTAGTTTINPSFASALIGTLAPGASAGVTVAVLVYGSGSDTLVAAATSDQPSTNDLGSRTNTSFVATGTADLGVSALAPSPAVAGKPEAFTFVVTNHDAHFATDAQFSLDFGNVPPLTESGALVSQGMVLRNNSTPRFGVFSGDLGTLAPGASAVITAVIIPQQRGPIVATLSTFSASDVDPVLANNVALAGVVVAAPPAVLDARLRPDAGSITTIAVEFDAPLMTSTAENLRNYRLTTVGSSTPISLRSAVYDPTTRTVLLRLARSLPRTGTSLTLVVGGPGTPGLSGGDGLAFVGPYTTTLARS